MRWLSRLAARWSGAPSHPDEPSARQASADRPEVVDFRGLVADLQSTNVTARRDAAILLSSLGVESAIRPLLTSYITFGDELVLGSLLHYGRRVTPVAAREAKQPSLGGVGLARLLRAASSTEDPTALRLAREHMAHPTPVVRAEAAAAMARLGDEEGVRRLWKDLEGTEPEVRLLALRALRRLPEEVAGEVVAAHLRRYLGTAGAVPEDIQVFAPLLIDPETDLARLLGERLATSEDNLNLAVGPAAGGIAEGQRDIVSAATPGWTRYYTTPRHSADEQLAVVEDARNAARAPGAAPVLLLGPLPSPEGPHPLGHVLTWLPANPYTVRILFLGPTDLTVVIEWWRYAVQAAEVSAAMEVILDLVTLSASRMTEEERLLLGVVDDDQRDTFMRALLGRL